jgi:hypothetical protein
VSTLALPVSHALAGFFCQLPALWPGARLSPLSSGNLSILVPDETDNWFAVGLVDIRTGTVKIFSRPLPL